MNIWGLLEGCISENSGSAAIIGNSGETLLDYKELRQKVLNRASEIISRTAKGDRVVIFCSNNYLDAINVLAVLASGRVVILTDLKYGEQRCIDIAKATRPKLIISEKEILEKIQEYDIINQIACLEKECGNSTTEVCNLPDINEDSPAAILFTSGTNGRPKGVVLTHRNIISNLESIKDSFPFEPKERTVIVRSLSHASAFTGELLYSFFCGASIAFYNGYFLPTKLVDFIKKTKGTFLGTTPTIFNHIYKHLLHGNHCLRRIVLSGECLLPNVAKEFYTALPEIQFFNAYGLTEASPRISYLDSLSFKSKLGSVGKPVKGVQVKIVNEAGVELQPEEVGEVIVSGPNVLLEYWNDQELTSIRLHDNFLSTRDLGYLDSEGFLYIVGRKDNMIIRAGVNIYPSEIEEVLVKHPSIKEALIWGLPDNKYGQIICAEVVPFDESVTETTIVSICRDNLPSYLWIDRIKIVRELSYNLNGKKIISLSEG